MSKTNETTNKLTLNDHPLGLTLPTSKAEDVREETCAHGVGIDADCVLCAYAAFADRCATDEDRRVVNDYPNAARELSTLRAQVATLQAENERLKERPWYDGPLYTQAEIDTLTEQLREAREEIANGSRDFLQMTKQLYAERDTALSELAKVRLEVQELAMEITQLQNEHRVNLTDDAISHEAELTKLRDEIAKLSAKPD
jgi:DNA repair exonuclease SbcCD ATPase subunit